MIYLDHAATTPPDERVAEAMSACMRGMWHNPGAAYSAADGPRLALRRARQALAAMLNAEPQEILFTSGGTEGNNQAMALARGGHAVIGAIEHASVLNAAKRAGCEVTLVPPDASGVVSAEAVGRALRGDTRLVCVQLANNETGVLQPVREIGALARAARVPFLCDAVQAFGRVPVDVKAMNIDLLTLSAHKFYGPRGAGCLYARQGVPLIPLIDGGGQEFGLRSGTENVPAVEGMRVAAELAAADMAAEADRERGRIARFVERLTALVPGCRLLGADAPRLPGLAAVFLPGLPSEQAVADLDLMGIAVSGGAACSARGGASHVYRAMGLCDADARCVLRFSIGRGTSEGDLSAAAEAVAQVYRRRAN